MAGELITNAGELLTNAGEFLMNDYELLTNGDELLTNAIEFSINAPAALFLAQESGCDGEVSLPWTLERLLQGPC